jgi:RNA polymerase primary sigma factor
MKAAQRFDETRGFKFISYAVRWIRQAILAGIAEYGRIVRLPLNKVGQVTKIFNTTNKLEQKLNREPSDQEIAEAMQIPVQTIREMSQHTQGKSFSLDKPIDDGSPRGDTHLDFLQSTDAKPTDHHLYLESRTQEIMRVLTGILSKRDVDILLLYFGIGQDYPLTLEEIGKKYDLTRERTRQIKEVAILKLRKS